MCQLGGKRKMTKLSAWQADLLLLGVAAIWGATFITVKNVLGGISPFVFISMRFTLAFLFLLLIYPKLVL